MPQPDDGFRAYAQAKLLRYMSQIRRCVELLSDDQLWQRPNAECNGIGNLILHLTGNVGQWALGGLGNREVSRDRAAEFAARGPAGALSCLERLETIVREASAVVGSVTDSELARVRSIQGYEVSGRVAIFHIVEHFAYHAGQIIHATKAIKNVALSLYDAEGRLADGNRSAP